MSVGERKRDIRCIDQGGTAMARILIVDDAKFMRMTLSSILNKAEHEVVGEAENGKDAIRLLALVNISPRYQEHCILLRLSI